MTDFAPLVEIKDDRFILSLDYCYEHNFVGRPIEGYVDPIFLLTEPAAHAIVQVQDTLDKMGQGLRLKIFDGYRPQRAVDDFRRWTENDCDKMQAQFYPNLTKQELINQGYLGVETSTHCRGSTLDLTVCVQDNHQWHDLDMGTHFDYFGEESNTAYPNLSPNQTENRLFLLNLMQDHGFENYPLEWWHFTLKDEPFPSTSFDIPIKKVA